MGRHQHKPGGSPHLKPRRAERALSYRVFEPQHVSWIDTLDTLTKSAVCSTRANDQSQRVVTGHFPGITKCHCRRGPRLRPTDTTLHSCHLSHAACVFIASRQKHPLTQEACTVSAHTWVPKPQKTSSPHLGTPVMAHADMCGHTKTWLARIPFIDSGDKWKGHRPSAAAEKQSGRTQHCRSAEFQVKNRRVAGGTGSSATWPATQTPTSEQPATVRLRAATRCDTIARSVS